MQKVPDEVELLFGRLIKKYFGYARKWSIGMLMEELINRSIAISPRLFESYDFIQDGKKKLLLESGHFNNVVITF